MQTRDDLARTYCVGRGVELGPGTCPTSVGPDATLCFVDKRSAEELKAYFGADDVVSGKRLAEYEKGSFDFLIAHHVLEHCSNVVEELMDWMSYLKDDGAVLFLSVPDAQRCSDISRLITPPTHFVYDYLMGVNDSSFESREHIYSFLWGWSDEGGLAGRSKQEASGMVRNAAHQAENDLHWHVFSAQTLEFVVNTAAALSGRKVSIHYADTAVVNGEHRIVVALEKTAAEDAGAARLREIRATLAPTVMEFCLRGLEGKTVYTLGPEDKGKIFIAEGGKACWVREPQTLEDRGITNVPAVYIEFGRERDQAIGPDLASDTFKLMHGGRCEAVHSRIKLAGGWGLEVSPGGAPLIKKSEGDVTYVDKVGEVKWRKSYLTTNNVQPDVILGERRLDDVFPGDSFDYVVSSHVLEHIPDFAGGFVSAQHILKPGGDLVMLVPDKRYTFDILRTPSTIDHVERAFEQKLAHPSREMILDFFANVDQSATAEALWKGAHAPRPTHSAAEVETIMQNTKADEVDVHCWVFTPTTLHALVTHVCEHHARDLEIVEITDTPYGGNEFLVHLRKRGGAKAIAAA